MTFKKTIEKITLFADICCIFFTLLVVSVWGGGLDDAKSGINAQKKGDTDRALKLYTQAINSGELPQKELALIIYNRGNIFLARDEYKHAIKDASKSIELDPSGKVAAYAYYIRGAALNGLGKFDLAIDDQNKS